MSTDPKSTEEMLKQTVSSLEELKIRERIAQSERYMEQLEQELPAGFDLRHLAVQNRHQRLPIRATPTASATPGTGAWAVALAVRRKG